MPADSIWILARGHASRQLVGQLLHWMLEEVIHNTVQLRHRHSELHGALDEIQPKQVDASLRRRSLERTCDV